MKRISHKKNSLKLLVAATVVAAGVFFLSAQLINKKEEGVVVAQIGNEKIFKSEIERKLQSIFSVQGQELKSPDIENLPQEVIEIISKEIYLDKELVKAAKKSNIDKNPDIKARLDDYRSKTLRQAYVDSLIKNEVTDQKISDKYAEMVNELSGKKEYHLSHIVVKTKEEAEKILKSLSGKKAIKFSDAAKKFSIDQESAEKGGDLGYTTEENIVKEIGSSLGQLKKEEVSNPIQSKFGWHLVKILDIRNAETKSFESLKESIREELTQAKINDIHSQILKDQKVKILINSKNSPQAQKEPEIKVQNTSEGSAAEEGKNPENAGDDSAVPTEQEATEQKPEEELEKSAKEEEQELLEKEDKKAASQEKSQKKSHEKSTNKKSKPKKHN